MRWLAAVKRPSRKQAIAAAVLAGVLAAFVLLLVRLHPTNFFGLMEDDTIYFSSAKALAEGKGYILPSLPGTPAQHKYPILYPWLLSWVWRWNPSFPANLKDAVALTAVFGAGFILLTYFFLRGLRGLSEAEALGLTAFCALEPHVLFYSGSVLTDIPFAALALAALMAGDGAMRREARPGLAVASGLLAGLAMLLRVLGVPVAAGIFLAGATRRSWRQLAIFSASVLPFSVLLVWNAISSFSSAAPTMGAIRPNGAWRLEVAYQIGYLRFWRMSVPNWHVLWAMLGNNASNLFLTPAVFFLYPLASPNAIPGGVAWLLVTVGILVGIVRQARRGGQGRGQEWKPVHWALPFYLAVVLLWNFSLADRLLVPFLPLFIAGLWLEGKHAFGMVGRTLVRGQSAREKVIAVGLGLALAVLASAITWNYAGGARSIFEKNSAVRGALLEEKREAYGWLRRHSPADARAIAEEDASLYLYTGRQAARPVALLPAGIFEPARLDAQLAHICDTARAIGADYWVISDDDFTLVWPKAIPKARAREKELEQVLPLVFRSGEGRVRIHSLGCVNHPQDASCRAADRVLFPVAGLSANGQNP
jgi:4-amino-4-deoxy-L-arabinose transferase-like glycosyltransferase